MSAWAIALGFLCAFLVARHVTIAGELRAIIRTAEDIRQGNLNRRFHVHTSHRLLQQLGGALNGLVDQFQRMSERTLYLEEARKRMISNMSHDLRTPLTSLLGYVEALQRDGNLTAEEAAQYLDIIAAKGRRMAELVEEFFELAKLEAEDEPIQLQKINLCEQVREAVLSFYHQFMQAGITPDLQIPEEPLYVRGDSNSIERIMNNLLANALRYGKDGGVIGVAVREEADRVRVDVWDRGRGIAEKDLPFIFDRLYTGEASRNAMLQGTGLGLTIAKKLVERQQGEIAVSSVPDEKTTFSFWLRKWM
ncbi:MAG: HAMP domain-containing sensor histidine kinase [Alicyclobacillaceae bacterium]|nr:HAMP domain-containing sensor histidine kinase [Alicyclobacillaceae bacterium]